MYEKNNNHNELTVKGLAMLRNERLLFESVSFTLQSHEAILIEGQNGSGKSSLLRILAGLLEPIAGDVIWNQTNNKQNLQEHLHYIGHSNGLKLDLTVQENLQTMLRLAWQPPEINLNDCLTALNLDTHQQTLVRHLSAGQRRKLGLARLRLIHKPLWLLDEPFAALDHSTEQFFMQCLVKHLTQGGMAVIATHQPLSIKSTSRLRLGP